MNAFLVKLPDPLAEELKQAIQSILEQSETLD